jgi:hypothetical protein
MVTGSNHFNGLLVHCLMMTFRFLIVMFLWCCVSGSANRDLKLVTQFFFVLERRGTILMKASPML